MIGNWVDQDDSARIETECKWAKNNSFITRSFSVLVEDRIDISGIQVIGWDAAEKRIRSWTFDSDGGFGQAVWNKKGASWYTRLVGTLPDGSRSSSVNVITPVDDSTFTWQSVHRIAAGELLPNIDEVTIVRQKPE